MKKYLFLTVLWGLLGWMTTAIAQKDNDLLQELAKDNKQSIDALVLYPRDIQLAILEAAKYPAALVQMQSIREKTSTGFRNLIQGFSQNQQEIFYDLSRYPGLLDQLVSANGNATALQSALQTLPPEQRNGAFDLVHAHPDILRHMQALYRDSNDAFDALIRNYPAGTQTAFNTLKTTPEVVDILNQDLRFTVMVGDLYRDDPAWVLHQMDSLQLVVAQENAQELADWKQVIENDPDARAELEAAATAYEGEQYDSESYPYYHNNRNDAVAVECYFNDPYPYWFGYPYWYPYPRWRPYPYWYDWGFYPYGSNVTIVFLPSPYFMHWYFDYPYHHYHYQHLSAHFVNHYYGHRHSGSTITMGVGEWRDRTRTIISDELLQDKNKLPERMQEYGRFEEKRDVYNQKNPQKALSEEKFLDKNARDYPNLARSKEQIKLKEAPAPAKDFEKAPAPDPRVKQPVQKPATQKPSPVTPPPVDKRRETAPIKDAKDYHQQRWDESKPAVRPAPAPKVTPPPTTRAPKAPAQAPKPSKAPTDSKNQKSKW